MSETSENIPKLKLKLTLPEEEEVQGTVAPIVPPTPSLTGEQVISTLPAIPPTSIIPVVEVEEESTQVKISISSIKSAHKVEAPISTEIGSEVNSEDTQGISLSTIENELPGQQSYERNDVAPSVTLQNALGDVKEPSKDGVFKNYASDFEKKSMSFMERFRTITRTPKTRIGFVLMIILIPVIGIGALMIVSPKKHSLSVYQANALYFYQKNFSETPVSMNPQRVQETVSSGSTQKPEVTQEIGSQKREEIKQQKVREFLKSKQ